jgi:putative FmdB family regulatory protein
MPIYDYACSACGQVTEVVHGINDHGPKFCPECGAEGTMTKNFTTPAIHFKGTGWAKKDRGSSARTAAKAKDDGPAAKDPNTKDASTKDAASKDSGTRESTSSTPDATSGDKGSSAGAKASTPASATSKPD